MGNKLVDVSLDFGEDDDFHIPHNQIDYHNLAKDSSILNLTDDSEDDAVIPSSQMVIVIDDSQEEIIVAETQEDAICVADSQDEKNFHDDTRNPERMLDCNNPPIQIALTQEEEVVEETQEDAMCVEDSQQLGGMMDNSTVKRCIEMDDEEMMELMLMPNNQMGYISFSDLLLNYGDSQDKQAKINTNSENKDSFKDEFESSINDHIFIDLKEVEILEDSANRNSFKVEFLSSQNDGLFKYINI